MLLFLLQVSLSASECGDSNNPVDCEGCSFKAATAYIGSSGYRYSQDGVDFMPGWTRGPGGGSEVAVLSGNGPWGGLKTSTGNPFISLQGTGASMTKTFENLVPGSAYHLYFWASQRPGSNNDQSIMKVQFEDGTDLLPAINPASQFSEFSTSFTATASTVSITWSNQGPAGDQSCFLADVSLLLEKDCGTGAKCLDAVPPFTGYQCSCDTHSGMVGSTVYNEKTECHSSSNLRDLIDQNTNSIGSNEQSFGTLTSEVQGILTSISDLVKKVDTINAQIGALKSLVDNGQVTLAQVEPDILDGSYIPQMESEGGRMEFTVAPNSRMTVNGERVITEGDIANLVKETLKSVLADFATALASKPEQPQ